MYSEINIGQSSAIQKLTVIQKLSLTNSHHWLRLQTTHRQGLYLTYEICGDANVSRSARTGRVTNLLHDFHLGFRIKYDDLRITLHSLFVTRLSHKPAATTILFQTSWFIFNNAHTKNHEK